jgi:hypothetical protein
LTTVLDNASVYDFFLLDSDPSPGIATIDSGGEREFDIQDQAQPLTLGSNTVQRLQKNATITYGFKLWLPAHFEKRDAWIDMFTEGAARRPNPRVYALTDLNAKWVRRVLVQKWGPQKPKAPGGPWDWMVMVHEYVRVKPFGGPALPPDGQDKILAENRKTIDQLNGVLTPAVNGQKVAARNGH